MCIVGESRSGSGKETWRAAESASDTKTRQKERGGSGDGGGKKRGEGGEVEV